MMLRGHGFRVIDLGVDVQPECYIAEVKQAGARVLGVSALLTASFQDIRKIIELPAAEGLRPQVRVMIGGGAVDEKSQGFVGADIQSRNAFGAARFRRRFHAAGD